VICLAIGIGLNTMMFSVTDGVLIQPLPYQDPDGIVVLHTTQKQTGVRRGSLSWLDLKDWQERSRSFRTLAGIQYRKLTVSDGGDSDRYSGAAISHDLFPLLGTSPQLGRGFSARTIVRGRAGGAHRARSLGAPLQLGFRRSSTCHPGEFAPHTSSRHAAAVQVSENQYLWLPLSEFAVSQQRAARGLQVFGRLGDGVTLEQARREADAVAANLAVAFPRHTMAGSLRAAAARVGDPGGRARHYPDNDGSVTMVLLIGVSTSPT